MVKRNKRKMLTSSDIEFIFNSIVEDISGLDMMLKEQGVEAWLHSIPFNGDLEIDERGITIKLGKSK
jgi:hypothetical protein